MLLLRRNAARAQRKFEKCSAGVPIRRGSDSPLVKRQTPKPTLILARRPANPSRGGFLRPSPELHFSARPAEAPQEQRASSANQRR